MRVRVLIFTQFLQGLGAAPILAIAYASILQCVSILGKELYFGIVLPYLPNHVSDGMHCTGYYYC